MTASNLTATQHAVLAYAIRHAEGRIDWFPESVKGGARKKVLDGLANRALIETHGADWLVSDGGYEAIGIERPAPLFTPAPADLDIEVAVTAVEATCAENELAGIPPTIQTRGGTKQATVIAMLGRAEGATIEQMAEATGWQKHTVRGALAGTLKKKLGLNITSHKAEGCERTYRIS